MNKLVISINPERLKYLNYNYTLIPGETEASDFGKSKMINKYKISIFSTIRKIRE